MKKSIFLFFAAILCAMSAQGATYLPGSWNNWNASGNEFSGNPALSKIELNDNTSYAFKVKNGESWLGNNGTISNDIENWTFSTSDKNCTLKTNKKGVYVFKWSSNKLSVIYPHIYTVAGSSTELLGTSWDPSNTNNNLQTDDYVTYKLVKNNVPLTKGDDISFKITVDNTWDKSYPSDNQTFNIPNTGLYNVTFTFNVLTKDVSVTTTEVKRYITGNANLVGANEWKADAQTMTYAAANNGTFSHTFNNLAAKKIYDLKITDGSWDNHWGYSSLKPTPEHVSTFSDNNISFYLSQPGNVTVTFDAIAGKIELSGNFAKIVPTINLLGLGDNWEATSDNKMESKSENIVSCTADLGVGVHGFKIYVTEFDKWYGNSAAIIRDNASVNKILTDGGSNVTIHTDVEGEYEFIWNYETKELSVVYPTATVEYDKIYFVNANNWSKVYAYLWLEGSDPTIKNAEWHGIDITANKEGTVNGYDIHYITFIKGSYDKCIFNDGNDKKTADLAIINDYKYFYDLTGSWYANLADIQVSTNKFILGEFNNWAKEHGEFLKVDENIYSLTIHIEAGTYEFKVVDNAWLGNGGTMERGGTSVETDGWTFDSSDERKCKLITDIAGDYTFTWNTNTKKLIVTYPAVTLGDGNNSSVIAATAGKTANVVLQRSFVANTGYYTLCLPFDIAAEKIGTAYELGTVTKYQADGGININLTPVSDIVAGKPYLVLPKTLDNPVFENVTIVDTEGSYYTVTGAGVKVTFTGIINGGGTTNGTTEYYVGDQGKLYNGTVDKLGLRAFFTITDEAGNPTPIRARVVAQEDEATSVEDITAPEGQVLKIIENGQLIIIRGGEKYNVQGQRL